MTQDHTRPLRIAMWSGPRNISTAMMRAFENRADTAVVDEPFYGAWLEASGESHPMADEIIEAMETDWRKVFRVLSGPVPGGKPIWYQKHMTHHILPAMLEQEWLSGFSHAFLIRDPRAVVSSYLDKRNEVSAEAVGVPQQWALYRFVTEELGQDPPIIDSEEFLYDPEGHLKALCRRLGMPFDPAMLSWPEGPRDTDGLWAPHWYDRVWRSTGFGPPPERPPELSGRARDVAACCWPAYEKLHDRRLRLT